MGFHGDRFLGLLFSLLFTLFVLVDEHFEEVREYLDALFYLSFDQVEHALCEVSIEIHTFRSKIVI